MNVHGDGRVVTEVVERPIRHLIGEENHSRHNDQHPGQSEIHTTSSNKAEQLYSDGVLPVESTRDAFNFTST